MTTTEQDVAAPGRPVGTEATNLWLHFSRMGAYRDTPPPVIVRGRGAEVFDDRGRRYLDGLSGLFVVQAGHGRRVLAEAAARQAEDLAFFRLWSYAHPAAIELSQRLAAAAPGGLDRVFFTTTGSDAVETAWKLAEQFFQLTGRPQKTKVVSRAVAYHGTTHGALSITGIPALEQAFEPLVPGSVRVPNTNLYRAPLAATTRRRSAGGRPTRSSRRSSSRARTPSRRSSSSRCRTPAAASRRLRATSRGCARSATGTTCCWSATR
jgi:adenosylmethionine-8-amino-7-oxononanoate aminotransferase